MMKYVKPMNCDQFTQHLLKLKDGDEINFACTICTDGEEQERYDSYNAECWYFAKVMHLAEYDSVMHLAEYDSRFILIDYCGGEEAFAIPLNNYRNDCDEYDMHIVPVYVETFFRKCPNLGDINSTVYVEMEEE